MIELCLIDESGMGKIALTNLGAVMLIAADIIAVPPST
jgi:hypothetical protein